MKARWLKFVRQENIDDHLSLGWMGARPNAQHHHMEYGIEMKWICECPLPKQVQMMTDFSEGEAVSALSLNQIF